MSCMQLQWPGIALYKPLSNKYLNNYIKKNRSKLGTKLVSIYDTARCFVENENKKEELCNGLLIRVLQMKKNLIG